MPISAALLKKYNVAVPRYTSYPTVPWWKEAIDITDWKGVFRQQFTQHNQKDGISLYIHLPFCESLCTYCGCNKKITRNHNVEEEYMQAILQEWKLYRDLMDEKPVVRELHLGGGTPTFFSPENLERLLHGILGKAIIHPEHEFSFEGHPNNTTIQHLEMLFSAGFKRVSYGVQDNDAEVQRIINRIQPFENVRNATENARKVGYKSVNFDLVYGLPLQAPESLERTILECISLKPDRVAFYSYAHVPWASRGQRLYSENDLPSTETKMKLYQLGKKLFSQHGYHDIGMDHFALPTDDLYKARKEGRLHRNFMGYTTQSTGLLLGLGVSSISDAGTAYAQNHKSLHDYYEAIENGELAVSKGYFLTEEDVDFKKYILDISCRGETVFNPKHADILQQYSFPELKKLEADGLLDWHGNGISVTIKGSHFIRNICRAFDLHLLKSSQESSQPTYSKAV